MNVTVFTVNDMTCGHCEATVRKAIETALPGTPVSVDLATHEVRVTGDRAKAEEAIREAGYTPELVTA
jgi:copper chaperone